MQSEVDKEVNRCHYAGGLCCGNIGNESGAEHGRQWRGWTVLSKVAQANSVWLSETCLSEGECTEPVTTRYFKVSSFSVVEQPMAETVRR